MYACVRVCVCFHLFLCVYRFADVEDDEEEEDRPDGLSEKPSQAMDTSTHAEESSFASKCVLSSFCVIHVVFGAVMTAAKLSPSFFCTGRSCQECVSCTVDLDWLHIMLTV